MAEGESAKRKSVARVVLNWMGIVSFLLIVLYFPVLIWSPPWGESGYYINDKYPDSIYWYFNKGKFKKLYFIKGRSYSGANKSGWNSKEYTLSKSGDRWAGKHSVGTNNYLDISLELNESNMVYSIGIRERYTLSKTTNPLLSWKIVLIELFCVK